MNSQLGLAHFWYQGDFVTHSIAVVLLLLSAASWTLILQKASRQWRASRRFDLATAAFWNAGSLPQALATLEREDKSGIFAGLALAGAQAAQLHQQHAARGIGAGVNASEFVTRALRSHIVRAQAEIEHGLTFLASVGSTAPFIGLFGTVWGIMNSFIGIAESQQTNLAVVAPGIAEALLATGIGLVAAIPAVILYNHLTRLLAAHRAALTETARRINVILSRHLDRSAAAGEGARLHLAAE